MALVLRYIYSWGSVSITLVTTVAFLSKTEKLPSLPFNLSPWPSHYHMTVKNRALTASGSPKQFFAVASTTICIVFSDRPSLPETNRCTPDNGAIPLLPTIMLGLLTDLLLVMSKNKCKKSLFFCFKSVSVRWWGFIMVIVQVCQRRIGSLLTMELSPFCLYYC